MTHEQDQILSVDNDSTAEPTPAEGRELQDESIHEMPYGEAGESSMGSIGMALAGYGEPTGAGTDRRALQRLRKNTISSGISQETLDQLPPSRESMSNKE